MAQTPCVYRQDGINIEYNPGTAVPAGTVYLLGSIVTIVPKDIAADELGATSIRGVFNVPKDNSNVTAAGLKLYWDVNGDPYGGTAGSGCFTLTQQGIDGTANKPAGISLEAAGTTTGDVDMLLCSIYGT